MDRVPEEDIPVTKTESAINDSTLTHIECSEDELKEWALMIRPSRRHVPFQLSLALAFLCIGVILSAGMASALFLRANECFRLSREGRPRGVRGAVLQYYYNNHHNNHLIGGGLSHWRYLQLREAKWLLSSAKFCLWLTVGLMGIGVGLVVVSILRTLRALRLFELGRWREGMSLSLFVFRNDAWLLYWRACCYFWALGETKKNVARAFQLFEKATKRGNVEALSVLGWMSERGLGCKLNMDTSKLYYQKSEAHKSNLINWLAQRTYRK